ncbi:MAG: glycosyltransferase [Candidatus Omnitrophica bacterium]|nr:glycosyltransferase [Candidatus Omnitrophota bacterium]
MEQSIRVSIIIPTLNRASQLTTCIRSLNILSFTEKEIIIIDDGSTDETFAIVRELFPSLRYIRHIQTHGASASRNEGARNARGEYLWFLDSDSVVESSTCLELMIRIIEQEACIGSIGGEYTCTDNGKKVLRKATVCSNGETLTQSLEENNAYLEECDYVATCNCFMRKELFVDIGGFDPVYRIFKEDCELGYQIRKKKLRNIVDMRTAVLHNIIVETRKGSLHNLIKNRVRFVFKNFPIKQILLLPFSEVAYIVKGNYNAKLMHNNVMATKHISPLVRRWIKGNTYKRYIGVLWVGVMYFWYLMCAYIINIVLLPATIVARFQKSYLS